MATHYGTINEEPEEQVIVGQPHPFIYETFPQPEEEPLCCSLLNEIVKAMSSCGDTCVTAFNYRNQNAGQ